MCIILFLVTKKENFQKIISIYRIGCESKITIINTDSYIIIIIIITSTNLYIYFRTHYIYKISHKRIVIIIYDRDFILYYYYLKKNTPKVVGIVAGTDYVII